MIRRAVLKDNNALKDIYNEAVLNSTATFNTEPRTDEEQLEWFNAHTGDHVLLVYDDGTGALGYASLSTYNPKQAYDSSVELSIYVDRSARGRGIGTALMTAILAEASARPSLHNVISLITSENTVSIRLHERFGFTRCGHITDAGRKFDRWLGVDIMQKLV